MKKVYTILKNLLKFCSSPKRIFFEIKVSLGVGISLKFFLEIREPQRREEESEWTFK